MNRETCREQLQLWRQSKGREEEEEETVDPSKGWGEEEEDQQGRSRGTECTDTDAADLYGDKVMALAPCPEVELESEVGDGLASHGGS
jgi:hypothetical protein